MKRSIFLRSGVILLGDLLIGNWIVLAAPPNLVPPPTSIHTISSSHVELHFSIDAEAAPLTRVELWYTVDQGRTWQLADPQLPKSPAIFEARADGLYGFFLVLVNESGASSPPPRDGQPPQTWLRIDRAAPTVQVLAVRPDSLFAENRRVHLRWSAKDDDLADNAVTMYYRASQTGAYRLIIDSQPAEGTYAWTVPVEASGRIDIKFTAVDRTGNLGTAEVDTLHVEEGKQSSSSSTNDRPAMRGRLIGDSADDLAELSLDTPEAGTMSKVGRTTTTQPASSFRFTGHAEPDAGEEAHALASAREARRRYEVGTWHRLRGDFDLAAARFREALELDGDLNAARCDLGGVYLLQGDLESARRELETVLAADPAHLPALKGLALVHTRSRNYRSAKTVLDKVLLLAPADPDAWLAFGDVLLFMGDRAAARKAWARIEALEADKEVKQRARKRLELYPAATGLME